MDEPKVNAQSKERRVRNFSEVSSGLNKKAALEEAQRYSQMASAYGARCPLGIDIAAFVALLQENKVNAALAKIREHNDFPGICGRVCSAPCEADSVAKNTETPIAIRALERFAADHGSFKNPSKKQKSSPGKKIAIIGSGPAGLAAAVTLAKNNFEVIVFESFPYAGGVLRYGIPEFRLPPNVLEDQLRMVRALGVQILTDCHVGKAVAVKDLLSQGFAAVLLATGGGSPIFPNLPGVDANGVYGAKEFLLQLNFLKKEIFAKHMQEKLGRRVAIIGNGNAALDCARMGVRLGRAVTMVFEDPEDGLHVHEMDSTFGKEEGVKFEALTRVSEIIIDEENRVTGLKLQRLDYADPHSTGDWQLIAVPDSETVLESDTVIIAGGYRKNSSAKRIIPEISCDGEGRLAVDSQTGMTSIRGIFAAGDAANNAGAIVDALASGRQAAEQIIQYLQGKKINSEAEILNPPPVKKSSK